MYDVRVVNGEGEKIFGPYERMEDAATERDRWVATGGCSTIEIRPIKIASEDPTPRPVKKK